MIQKKIEVYGTEYVMQKVTPREWIRLRSRCKDKNGNLIDETFYSEILEHVVVNPKVSIDDFEEIEELEEVVKEAITFQCTKQIK